jgi:hypothetical protein
MAGDGGRPSVRVEIETDDGNTVGTTRKAATDAGNDDSAAPEIVTMTSPPNVETHLKIKGVGQR